MTTKRYPDGWTATRFTVLSRWPWLRHVDLYTPGAADALAGVGTTRTAFPAACFYTRFPRLRASLAWRRRSRYGRLDTAYWACIAACAASFKLPGLWKAAGWVPSAASVVLAVKLDNIKKEARRGRHRSPQADHRGAGTQAVVASRPLTAAARTAGTIGAHTGLTTITTSGWHVPAPPDGPLETVRQDIPVLAHRWAWLDFTDGPRFRTLNAQHGTFGIHEEARCKTAGAMLADDLDLGTWHDGTPDPGCTCGFYAAPADMLPDWRRPGCVELDVQLSGRIIEHERGYRAQFQTVLAARVPNCMCGQPAVRVWVVAGATRAWDCGNHTTSDRVPFEAAPGVAAGPGLALAMTIAQLTDAYGVPFTPGAS